VEQRAFYSNDLNDLYQVINLWRTQKFWRRGRLSARSKADRFEIMDALIDNVRSRTVVDNNRPFANRYRTSLIQAALKQFRRSVIVVGQLENS